MSGEKDQWSRVLARLQYMMVGQLVGLSRPFGQLTAMAGIWHVGRPTCNPATGMREQVERKTMHSKLLPVLPPNCLPTSNPATTNLSPNRDVSARSYVRH